MKCYITILKCPWCKEEKNMLALDKKLQDRFDTAVYDAGKPYEEKYSTTEALREGLKTFYLENKDSDYQYDCKVYLKMGDQEENDITETQMIDEMVSEIREEVQE